MKYCFEIYLDGKFITSSNNEYESYEEAKEEGQFAIYSYADLMNRHWSEFELNIEIA